MEKLVNLIWDIVGEEGRDDWEKNGLEFIEEVEFEEDSGVEYYKFGEWFVMLSYDFGGSLSLIEVDKNLDNLKKFLEQEKKQLFLVQNLR